MLFGVAAHAVLAFSLFSFVHGLVSINGRMLLTHTPGIQFQSLLYHLHLRAMRTSYLGPLLDLCPDIRTCPAANDALLPCHQSIHS
jgi:hypothetical protein